MGESNSSDGVNRFLTGAAPMTAASMGAAPMDAGLSLGERLQELFLAAVQIRDAYERGNFLREQCGEDRALLQEVQSLLASHFKDDSFLERPAYSIVLPATKASAEKPEFDSPSIYQLNGRASGDGIVKPGERPLPSIPGYEILELLGRGGMGVVYKARQAKLNRVVALKMIRESNIEERDLSRFRTEAEALARPQHPNIVQIFEVGEHEGAPYLALEYVDGGTLAQKINGTPQPVGWTAEIMQILAQAVHAAHQAGILHRDLKPANVLLRGEGRGARGEGRGRPMRLAPRPSLLASRPQDYRFWAGQEARRSHANAERRLHGHAQLHGAGTSASKEGHRSRCGRLCARRDFV